MELCRYRSRSSRTIKLRNGNAWRRLNGRQRIHGTLIVHCRFAHMSLLEIVTHVEALIFAAFGILISLSGIASLWAFRKIGRLAS